MGLCSPISFTLARCFSALKPRTAVSHFPSAFVASLGHSCPSARASRSTFSTRVL